MPTIFFTLRFDATMEQAVRQLWEAIAQGGIEVPGLSGHRPHITVAAYDADTVEHYVSRLDEAVEGIERFPLRLDSLGIFPERGVVFLAPRVTDALFSLHRRLAQYFSGPSFPSVKYEELAPNNWVPHCTLVTDRPPQEVAHVVEVCHQHWTPISGVVEAIGVLVPPALTDLHEARLRWITELLA